LLITPKVTSSALIDPKENKIPSEYIKMTFYQHDINEETKRQVIVNLLNKESKMDVKKDNSLSSMYLLHKVKALE
jgi:hypothetical protein